jgi:hypothetical protein
VLEDLEVCLEMTAYVLGNAEAGIFEVHLIHLGRSHILGTMFHNADILGVHLQSMVASLVSC